MLGATGGRINFGPSPADRRRADLIERARTPVVGCHRVAVISLKGGVGKTTTTAALGAMFANLRGDRVIAVDANPDRGTLIERVPRQSGATVRHLLEAARPGDSATATSARSPRSRRPGSRCSRPTPTRPRRPALSEQDYRDTVDTLERFYNLILTDCGTGLLHDAMRGVLGLATSLVVVSSASLDGARSASATLDWLEAHGMEQLAKDAVVVISSVRPGGGIVDVMQLEDHFAARCRAVVTDPVRRSPRGRRRPRPRRARPGDAGRLQGAGRCRRRGLRDPRLIRSCWSITRTGSRRSRRPSRGGGEPC